MSTPFYDAGEAARFAAYRMNQQIEYGTWVAAAHIHIDGVLGYVAGHPVPVSVVERYGLVEAGLVVAAGTPLPDPAELDAVRKRERLAALDAERAALAAELDDSEPDPDDDDRPQEAAAPDSPAAVGQTHKAGRARRQE